jgi:hypothetical protein
MSAMAIQTLKFGGKEFVILPKREYERLAAKHANRVATAPEVGDVAEAKRRLHSIARGRTRAIPLNQFRAEPRLIWLRIGNCTRDALFSPIAKHAADIDAFERDPVASILVLS